MGVILVPTTSWQKGKMCFPYPGSQGILAEHGGAASTRKFLYLGTLLVQQ